jgi:hypothetical protein
MEVDFPQEHSMRIIPIILVFAAGAFGQSTRATSPASQPGVGNLPHIQVDVGKKTVRMECEALAVTVPLEFVACVKGTSEHESVMRSEARPSHLHLALLIIGLTPGQGVHYDEEAKKWVPPSGAPMKLSVEFEKAGKLVTLPAEQTMRDIKTKKPMPPVTWVFTGSHVMPDKNYAADRLGYLVTVVNFQYSPVDLPALVSDADETLEWEMNPEVVPAKGTKMTLIFQPAEKVTKPPRETGTPRRSATSRPE